MEWTFARRFATTLGLLLLLNMPWGSWPDIFVWFWQLSTAKDSSF